MMTAFISGFLALSGAFLGAYLTRQTQREKWLLERRSEAFAEFLLLSYEAFNNASNIMNNREGSENDRRDWDIFEAYVPVLSHARVVRLYLPKQMREKFHSLARAQYDLHANEELGDSRFPQMDKNSNEMQQIFKKCLVEPKFNILSRMKQAIFKS